MEKLESEIERRLPLIIVEEINREIAQSQVAMLFDYGYFLESSHAVYTPDHECIHFVVYMVKRA